MPKLLRYHELTDDQRAHADIRSSWNCRNTLENKGASCRMTDAEWYRFKAYWFTNDGKRPVRNRSHPLLSGTVIRDVLAALRFADTEDGRTGKAFADRVLHKLNVDCIDVKADVLVLADWLEERGHDLAPLLRKWCSLKHSYLDNCNGYLTQDGKK